MIRNFVPNLWSKPVNPRMGVVLNFVEQKKGEPGGARSVQSLSLSLFLSLIRALRFLSRSYFYDVVSFVSLNF